jgi:membrane protease YdiL (CAAX protease family)
VSLAATGAWVAAGGTAPAFASPPVADLYPLPAGVDPWTLFPLVFVQTLLVGSPMGEEIGWRGYVLPRLQARLPALAASLALGVAWGLWHLPLVVASGGHLGWFLLGIVADAVLFTWLYNSTDGSLLLALLFHASIAVTGLYLATSGPAFLAPAAKWLVVAAVVARYGPATLADGRRVATPTVT